MLKPIKVSQHVGTKTSCGNVKYLTIMSMHAQSLSCVWLSETLWTVVCQTPLSMEFSRQEHWSGLPFPPPGYNEDSSLCIWMACALCSNGTVIASSVGASWLLLWPSSHLGGNSSLGRRNVSSCLFSVSEMTVSLGPARMSPEAFPHYLSILLLSLLNLSPSISNWIFFCFTLLFLKKYCLSYPSMAPVANNISLNPYIQMKFTGRI